LFITTSASGTGDSDEYSYTFTIEDDIVDPTLFHATLVNTSLSSLSSALIDLLAFNMDAILDTDFSITTIIPDWDFSAAGGGIQFDYIGERDEPADRLSPGNALTFDFDFVDDFLPEDDPFSIWTGEDGSLGTGIGGGEDFGQVAVSFQQLGDDGNGSDLLASNYDGNGVIIDVPEPGTLFLLGFGLLSLAVVARRKTR